MQIPLMKQGDILVAIITESLSDKDMNLLRERLLNAVGKHRSKGAILDVTSLDVLDSFAIRTLHGIVYMLKLRGSETVIVGIRPEVAFSMVQLGLTLEGVRTAIDLEDGLTTIRRMIRGSLPHVR
jgi:rsbT antagonist protein RsbS